MNMKLEKLDEKYLGRAADSEEIEVLRQEGSYLYNSRGKKYIDFTMGWCVGNFGWDEPSIKKRVDEFVGPDYVTPSHLYKPWAKLAQELETLTPGKLRKSFRAVGGTEAVEIALQVAMTHTRRQKFISIEDSYHGNSIAARSLGSPSFGKWYRNSICPYRIQVPLDLKSAERLSQRLKKRDIAAVIMEPIVCNLGVEIPTSDFMNTLRDSCRKSGTLLIFDEVACGIYRTGKLFATEHYDVSPDILCLGKALTNGMAPIGATVVTEEVAQSMRESESVYSTYGWHPRSTEAALATLDYVQRNKDFLETNIREMGSLLVDELEQMKFKIRPSIRRHGLAIGVKFESAKYAETIVERAREKGLLLTTFDQGFSLFPDLNLERGDAEAALQILRRSI